MADDPTLRALVLCNTAFQDKANRWNVIGIIDTLNVDGVPAIYNQLTVYFRVADVPLKGTLRIDIRDSLGNISSSSGLIPYEIADGIREFEGSASVGRVTFAKMEEHRVELYFGDAFVGSWPLTVRHRSSPTW